MKIGRLVNHLKEIGQLDNTLIFISIGDNGASKEGIARTAASTVLSRASRLPEEETIAYNLAKIDEIGTPMPPTATIRWAGRRPRTLRSSTGNQMPTAKAERTIRLIVYWPKGIKDKGGIRTQYSHVIDLLPTTLDLVGIKAPEEIRGVKQQPIEGTSRSPIRLTMPTRRGVTRVQYYYIFGSRSIYDDGWKAELAYPNDVLAKQ